MIICGNPRAQYLAHKEEIDNAVARVLDGGSYILGEQVRAFEEEFGSFIGTTHAVAVGSGTDALRVALSACDIGPGDEVISVAHTAVATVAAIELTGATPVLVDIDPHFFTLDARKLESQITTRTKAIIPVHLYGQPADLGPILEIARLHKLRVIEDCAQAHGAMYKANRVGSLGDIGCFSFYPTKNLGALGDGGMLVTGDAELAAKAVLLREYGWTKDRVSEIAGWNTRLDEVQAAILRVKLKWLDRDNTARGKIAQRYFEALADCEIILPEVRQGSTHAFHLFVVRSARRDELQAYLKEGEIGALVHYPVPVHLQPAYKDRLPGCDSLPETERAAKEVLSLPIYPELNASDIRLVVNAVHEFAC